MGIGFAEGKTNRFIGFLNAEGLLLDLLVCVALGVDMVYSPLLSPARVLTIVQADCVFPTRTARFGVALTFKGPLNLSKFLTQEALSMLLSSTQDCENMPKTWDPLTRTVLAQLVAMAYLARS